MCFRGKTLGQIRRRMVEEIEKQGGEMDAIVLHGGTNDIPRGFGKVPIDWIKREIRTTMDKVEEVYGDRIRRVWSGMLPREAEGDTEDTIREIGIVNGWTQRYAQERGWTFVDHHPHFMRGQRLDRRLFFRDGLHLDSGDGLTRFVRNIAEGTTKTQDKTTNSGY